jgi:hypothetical protein
MVHRLYQKYQPPVSEQLILKVIQCEGTIYGTTNANKDKTGHIWSRDWGLLQINDYYHKARMQAMGLDIYKSADSLEYGFVLMREHGLKEWSASKFCWNK